jgi:hypothetical protein
VILLILDLVPRYSRPAVAKYAVKHDPEPLLFILVVDALQSLMADVTPMLHAPVVVMKFFNLPMIPS